MEETEKDKLELKLAINNLLWMNLPGNITLEEAEVMACEILDIINNPLTYLSNIKQYEKTSRVL